MHRLYRIAFGMLLSGSILYGESICVNKLFHHEGVDSSSSSIELGWIVLYLDQYPKKVVKTVSKQKGKTEQSFFLPDIEVKSQDVLGAIERINTTRDPRYAITITQATGPHKGLKITFVYDATCIGIKRHRYDSVSLQKSIVFRLYNNTLIEKMKDMNKPILQVACHTPPKVIIDCGHGGTDLGAVGCHNIMEKNISLQVGLQVAQLLKKKNIDVCLTRDSDQTLLLDERTTFANKQKADLFVSIHANAAKNNQHSGIETYCLRKDLFMPDDGDGEFCLFDTQLDDKYAKSQKLAQSVHRAVLSSIPSHYAVKDRSVKYDVAQVLLGTTMPAILVEIGFVTHEQEALRLAQASYQSCIAQGIVQGINTYLTQVQS